MFRPIFAILILCLAAGPALSQAAPASGVRPPPKVELKGSQITAVTPTPDDRARQWLVLVDDKNYTQSWSDSGKAFQTRQKNDAWAKDAKLILGRELRHTILKITPETARSTQTGATGPTKLPSSVE